MFTVFLCWPEEAVIDMRRVHLKPWEASGRRLNNNKKTKKKNYNNDDGDDNDNDDKNLIHATQFDTNGILTALNPKDQTVVCVVCYKTLTAQWTRSLPMI